MSFWVHWSEQTEARNVLWECLQLSYQEETTLKGTETSSLQLKVGNWTKQIKNKALNNLKKNNTK